MRRIVLLAVCFATAAWGGDKLLGTIIVTDGGTASNRTTGFTAYACPANRFGGCFGLGSLTPLDVQCDQDCLVCTDESGCDAGTGVKLGATMLLPTSTGPSSTQSGRAYNSDGGTAGHVVTYYGGWISVAPWNTDGGGTTAVMKVFSRNGLE